MLSCYSFTIQNIQIQPINPCQLFTEPCFILYYLEKRLREYLGLKPKTNFKVENDYFLDREIFSRKTALTSKNYIVVALVVALSGNMLLSSSS
jgi:hypothetical protein